MLLNKDRRAEALAELEAQDVEKERAREQAENARRRQAASGIFLCLLELKRPLEAAEAAGVRLGMCETGEERRQVQEYGKGWGSAARSSHELCLSVMLDTDLHSMPMLVRKTYMQRLVYSITAASHILPPATQTINSSNPIFPNVFV